LGGMAGVSLAGTCVRSRGGMLRRSMKSPTWAARVASSAVLGDTVRLRVVLRRGGSTVALGPARPAG
jgi:hypothetical protein